MVLEPTVVLVGAVNLLALGAAYGSLRQSVQECCRRITRLENCSNGKRREHNADASSSSD